ncbi:PRD domain-containing protein [Fusibacter ferrireducens]|uniref:PRD domain-containing protein n=1 Tax=Fusibacter ferrireducens TaxID=2785058 RepID=A0ABR9ZWB3_9FIRM|nr:PRD domain-containing protein [Fusibacter ferrireducens]MBF4694733.1 PRD domain-containing protein [Fusibacter ferrireducens]
MDITTLLKQKMSLEDENIVGFKDDFEEIENYVAECNVVFTEHYALGFYSHMYSYLKRLKDGERVEGVDLSIRSDIETEIYDMTAKLLEKLAKKYNQEVDVSEVILAAIHIQTAVALGRS